MSASAAALPGGSGVHDPYAHRYVIAAAVSLASLLQVIDTSIVNVAIPSMMGSLGATIQRLGMAWGR